MIFDDDDNIDTFVDLHPSPVSILVYSVDQCRVLVYFFWHYILLQAHVRLMGRHKPCFFRFGRVLFFLKTLHILAD